MKTCQEHKGFVVLFEEERGCPVCYLEEEYDKDTVYYGNRIEELDEIVNNDIDQIDDLNKIIMDLKEELSDAEKEIESLNHDIQILEDEIRELK